MDLNMTKLKKFETVGVTKKGKLPPRERVMRPTIIVVFLPIRSLNQPKRKLPTIETKMRNKSTWIVPISIPTMYIVCVRLFLLLFSQTISKSSTAVDLIKSS